MRPQQVSMSNLPSVWDFVFQILTTSDCGYGPRPEVLGPSPTTRVFVERSAERREPGGDRWRQSGGQRGSTTIWLQEHIGLRKRYGKVLRKAGKPLKFCSFTLMRRPGENEDRTTVVFVVDADQDRAALPSATHRAETSPSPLDLYPARSQLTGSIPTIDLSASGFTESFSQLPHRLSDREHRSDLAVPQEVATIDASVALSFHERTESFDNSGFSSVSEDSDFHGLSAEFDSDCVDYGSPACVQFENLGSLEDCTVTTCTGPWDDWETESTASSESYTPCLSMETPACEMQHSNALQQLSSETPNSNSPQSPALQHKRKHLQDRLDSFRAPETKKVCSRPMAGCAALGLCAVLGSLFSQAGTGGFASYAGDTVGRCAAGPAGIANAAVDGAMCPEGTMGSQCPYECLGGFTASGSHMCVRGASGSFQYTGGECVPNSPCQGGVTLVDNGDLTLLPASAHHQCQWDLVCTDKSLAPTLRFARFSVSNGNVSVSGGTLSGQLGSTAHTAPGPNSLHVADLREKYGGQLWQRGSAVNVSSPDVIILRGDDPWWISQEPIRVAPSPTASVLYKTNTRSPGMPDSFMAWFSCAPFQELCTATDTMELSWVGVTHGPPEGFSYPPHLAQWATLADHFGWPPAASPCKSSPCAHGTCVDSDSQQAYSEETAFGFVCNCYPNWSGDLCDEKPSTTEQQLLPCTAAEDDCDAATSSCGVLGPGQHECICFPGFTNAQPGESPRLEGKRGMATPRCKLEIEHPAVGQSWVSGPGYEAFGGVVIGSFGATVGESPAYLQASTFLESSAFFDPAAYGQVLLSTPPVAADGCSVDAYGGPGGADVDMEYVMVLSSAGGCPLWLKVIIAQRMAAKSVIIYGDEIPAGSAISWEIDDTARLASAIDDPYDVGGTAQQLGLACVSAFVQPKLGSKRLASYTLAFCCRSIWSFSTDEIQL